MESVVWSLLIVYAADDVAATWAAAAATGAAAAAGATAAAAAAVGTGAAAAGLLQMPQAAVNKSGSWKQR